MSTLLMRLQGVKQSWGVQDYYRIRDTNLVPSKSAVIGILAACEGRARSKDLSDLVKLKFGVRIIQGGVIHHDFQTTKNWIRANGGISEASDMTDRYYLSGADFLVGFEGEEQHLLELEGHLKTPIFQPFLGRKDCLPTLPLYLPEDGVVPEDLRTALTQWGNPLEPVELYLESRQGRVVYDIPTTFERDSRVYGARRIERFY